MSDPELGLDSLVMDTDIASRWFKRRLDPPVLAKLYGRHAVVTFVTIGEMTAWTAMRSWGGSQTEELRCWLDRKMVLSGDEAVGSLWGRITSSAKRAGRTPQTNDSWIAACCLAYGVPLLTNNARDFQYFADNHGLQLL